MTAGLELITLTTDEHLWAFFAKLVAPPSHRERPPLTRQHINR
jgi:hypothetical protein